MPDVGPPPSYSPFGAPLLFPFWGFAKLPASPAPNLILHFDVVSLCRSVCLEVFHTVLPCFHLNRLQQLQHSPNPLSGLFQVSAGIPLCVFHLSQLKPSRSHTSQICTSRGPASQPQAILPQYLQMRKSFAVSSGFLCLGTKRQPQDIKHPTCRQSLSRRHNKKVGGSVWSQRRM